MVNLVPRSVQIVHLQVYYLHITLLMVYLADSLIVISTKEVNHLQEQFGLFSSLAVHPIQVAFCACKVLLIDPKRQIFLKPV